VRSVRRSRVVVLLAVLALAPAYAQEPTVEELETAIKRVEAAHREPGEDVARHVNLALAKLKLKKAKMLQGGGFYFGANADEEIAEGMRLLEMLERGELYRPPLGKLDELAYITDNDGTVQPYYVHIPEAYDAARPWPLIVFLHGYVPSISMVDPWLLSDEFCDIAERHGCLLVIPYGRRNTDFQGVGEVDIFRAITEVKRLYSVDPARIYLSGVSMGGMGAWNMALRHPGVFAATTPMSGQTDMFRWWGWDPESMTPYRRFLVAWDNPEEMAPNARGQHFFAQHGELDHLIPVVESRSMVERLRSLGIPIDYHEFAGESHYIYWDTPCYENAWSWSRQFTLEPSPARVTFRCFSLAYNRAFWLTIDRLKIWGTPATVDASVADDGARLDITCDNVAALTIDLAQCPLRPQAETYQVAVNGEERAIAPTEGALTIEIEPAPATGDWPPAKRKGLCGPAEDVFNTRFILVQGTAGSDEQDLELASQVGIWSEEWDGFADGAPRVCTDSELLHAEIDRSNLVLFGTPETNSVIARLADRLPIEIGDHRYAILGRTFEGDDLGLVLCYPNPLNPDRYVLIYAGELYGRKLSINHKHDLLPDFLVFDSSRFATADAEWNVFGGWFDVDWQPSQDLAWEGDEAPAPRIPEG